MASKRQWNQDLKELVQKYGRTITKIRSGHYRLDCIRNERPAVFASQSPSCSRALKNVERDLKRNDKPREESSHG